MELHERVREFTRQTMAAMGLELDVVMPTQTVAAIRLNFAAP